jgi:hypothetical protein
LRRVNGVKTTVGLVALACAVLLPSAAGAFSPYLIVPEPAVAEASPAYRYANMTDADALAELTRRGVLYERQGEVPGVRAPVRLTGRLHGVYVHSSLPPEQRVVSPFEILDARLALALDDFCALLEKHDVDELVHYTMYRPNVAAPVAPIEARGAPVGRPSGARPRVEKALAKSAAPPSEHLPASARGRAEGDATHVSKAAAPKSAAPSPPPASPRASAARSAASPTSRASAPSEGHGGSAHAHAGAGHNPPAVLARREVVMPGLHSTTWAAPGTRHPAGLAIDVAKLHKRDGRWLSIQDDFHGHLGARTCGDGAVVPESPDARELRALVCESLGRATFTYVLTPNYNAEHADHFHMEIKPGVRWFLYH